MTDIVERLRSGELCGEDRCRVMDEAGGCTCAVAADEITRLRTEVEELREKLRTTHLYYQNQLQHNGFWSFIIIVSAFIIGINIP